MPPAQVRVNVEKPGVVLFRLFGSEFDSELGPGGNAEALTPTAINAPEIDRFRRLAGLAVAQDTLGGLAVNVATIAEDLKHSRFPGEPCGNSHFDVS